MKKYFIALALILSGVALNSSAFAAMNVKLAGYRIGVDGKINLPSATGLVQVAPNGIQTVRRGEEVVFTAIPSDGYSIIGWQKFYEDPIVTKSEPTPIVMRESEDKEYRSVHVKYEENENEESVAWLYIVPVLQGLSSGEVNLMRLTVAGYRIGSSGPVMNLDKQIVTVTASHPDTDIVTAEQPQTLTAFPTRDYKIIKWQKFVMDPRVVVQTPAYSFGEESQSVTIYPEEGFEWMYVAVVLKYEPVRSVNVRCSSFSRGELTVSPQSATYMKGDWLTLTAQPDKGYQFVRWSDGDTNRVRKVQIDDDVDLQAYLEPVSSRVEFSAGPGTLRDLSWKRVAFGQNFGELASCVRTGYAFAGWWTAEEDGEKVVPEMVVANASADELLTLFARWTANRYEVTFDANGGVALSDAMTVTYDQMYGKLPGCTRTGYAFEGWFTAADGGEEVESSTKVSITTNQNLYAHWIANEYSLTVNPNGGQYEGDENERTFPEKLRYDATNLNAIAAAVRGNYTLKGYYTSRNGGVRVYDANGLNVVSDLWTADYPDGVYKGTSDLVVYANWQAATNNVSLEKEGGTNGTDSVLAVYDAQLPTIDLPARKGYDFEGYYTQKVGTGTKYYDANGYGLRTWTSEGTTALYANWTPHAYRVQYDIGSGMLGVDAPSSARVGTAFRVSAPKMTGHTFAGWSVTGAGADYSVAKWGGKSDDVTLPVTNDTMVCFDATSEGVFFLDLCTAREALVTLKAYWTTNTYEVTFDANGGAEPVPTSKTVTYGQPYGELATCTRTGYAFAGWWTEKSAGTQVKSSTAVTITADQTLHARWAANTYKVTFDANGGMTTTGSTTVTYDADYGMLPVPTKPGYTFDGWYTADGAKVENGTRVAITADQTLYARWTANAYSLTIDPNGGLYDGDETVQVLPTKLYTGATNLNEIAVAVRENYSLKGYYTSRNGGVRVYDSEGHNAVCDYWSDSWSNGVFRGTSDLVVYANWTANENNVALEQEGGEGGQDGIMVRVDLPVPAITSLPTRVGYDFDGYYTSKSGGGTRYFDSNGKGLKNWTSVGTTVLYANWVPHVYKVEYEFDGGTPGIDAPSSAEVGKPFGVSAPSRKGYSFVGWSVAGEQVNYDTAKYGPTSYSTPLTVTNDAQVCIVEGRESVYFRDLTMEKGAIVVLVANWAAADYKVTFDSNGGTEAEPAEKSVTHGQPYGELAFSELTGYTLNGWWTEKTTGTQVKTNTVVTIQADQTLYAHWTANTYWVAFHGTNGTDEASGTMERQSFTYDKEQALAANRFTREGYVFAGWADGEGVEATRIFADRETVRNLASEEGAVVDLYATWMPGGYMVTFDANGGDTPEPKTKGVAYGQPYGELADCARTGYTFAGWWTAKTDGEKVEESTTVTNACDHKLYAHWTTNTYEVTFDANGGGEPSFGSMNVTYDAPYLTLPTCEREDYSFMGWYTAKDGGKKVESDTKVTIAENHTLFARWAIDVFKVSFTYHNSDGNSVTTMPQNVEVGRDATPPSTGVVNNWKGHEFIGWEPDYHVVRANTICVALYKDKTYTVTFVYCDAEGNEREHDEYVQHGNTVSFDFVEGVKNRWDGHAFTYWSIDGKKVEDIKNVVVTSDVKVMAHYEGYAKIVYSPNGGKGTMPERVFTNFVGYVRLETNAFVKTGYTFTGWKADDSKETRYKDGDTVYVTDGMVLKLTAQWAPITYTVHFDGNGGVCTNVSDVTMTYDDLPKEKIWVSVVTQDKPELKTPFTKRDGCDLVGWGLDTDTVNHSLVMTTNAFNIFLTISTNLTTEANTTVTLYAIWRERSDPGPTTNTYEVTFNANGGAEPVPTSKTVTYGQPYGELATCTRTGYTFDGWYTAKDGGKKVETNTVVTIQADQTLYAHWTANTYWVAFHGTNGTDEASGTMERQSFTYDKEQALAANCFTREGYVFAGWADGEGVEATRNFDDRETVRNLASEEGAVVDLYATWTPGGYMVTFDANGGDTPEPKTRGVAYGQPYGDLAYCTRTGYTFAGWWTAKTDGEKVDESTTVTNACNHTLYAHWERATYTIEFDGNGAKEGWMDSTNVPCNVGVTLPSNTYVRAGYDFGGWSTNATGNVLYKDKATVTNLAECGGTATLYAVWQDQLSHALGLSPDDGIVVTVDPEGAWTVANGGNGIGLVRSAGSASDSSGNGKLSLKISTVPSDKKYLQFYFENKGSEELTVKINDNEDDYSGEWYLWSQTYTLKNLTDGDTLEFSGRPGNGTWTLRNFKWIPKNQ